MRYGIADPLTDSKGQVILVMYESVPDPDRSLYSEHCHTEIELCYVLYGSGIYKVEDRQYNIKKGALFIFPSNKPHWIKKISGGKELRFLVLKFEPRLIWSPDISISDKEFLLPLFDGKYENMIENGETAECLYMIMKEMYGERLAGESGNETIIKADLHKLIVFILRHEKIVPEISLSKRTDNLKNIEKAIQYINDNLSRKFTLEELASISCFSRTYFSALFKELNGLSPWEYINIKRVEKAKNLLLSTDMTILFIANECGFNNISNFNRIFRKITGKNPSDYRRKN